MIRSEAGMAAADLVLAEDDPEDAFMILRALRRCRADLGIQTVRDGVALIEHLNERLAMGRALPQLVLLDLNMPRMDGREVLAAMKADARLSAVPVVVLTTSIEHEDRDRAQRLGAAGYLTKPDGFGLLVELLRTLTEQWFGAAPVAEA